MRDFYSTWSEVPAGRMVKCPVYGLYFIKAVGAVICSISLSEGWITEYGYVPRDGAGFVGV